MVCSLGAQILFGAIQCVGVDQQIAPLPTHSFFS